MLTVVMFDGENELFNVDIYGKGEDIDATKYLDYNYEVHGGNADAIMSELLQHSDKSMLFNIEGNKVEDIDLGQLFRLILANDLDIARWAC